MQLCHRCPQCSSERLLTEEKLCCRNGTRIVPSQVFPHSFRDERYAEWIYIFNDIPPLFSNQLNNEVAFASLGTDFKANDETAANHRIVDGVVFRAAGTVSMLGLHGRVFHTTRNQGRFGISILPVMPPEMPGDSDFAPLQSRIADYFEIHNGIARHFKRAIDNPNIQEVRLDIRDPGHSREPFVLFCAGADGELNVPDVNGANSTMSFLLWTRGNLSVPVFIPRSSGLIEPATYPLLFPHGVGGWYVGSHLGTPQYEDGSAMTLHDYVKYVIYQRQTVFARVPFVFQLWVLDMFSRWQEATFQYMMHQKAIVAGMRLRIERYRGCDLPARRRGTKIGRPLVLPTSVPGSPANRAEAMKDASAVVAKRGRPSFFITMTCNPRWEELAQIAKEFGVAEEDYSPEAFAGWACRLWRQKRAEFIRALRNGALFDIPMSRAQWLQAVDEFQKRYWPHIHLLLRCVPFDKPDNHIWTTADIDRVVTARLFLYELCPLWNEQQKYDTAHEDAVKSSDCDCLAHKTYRLVKKFMVHSCRVGYCREDAGTPVCKKHFPKRTTVISSVDGKGFWHLARPRAEDRFVVPYSPNALRTFKCHINVEPCTAAHTVKYMHSYMNKGCDWTTLAVEAVGDNMRNEFYEYQRLRHVGFAEAFLRMTDMDFSVNEPAVTRIPIHLENEQSVVFHEDVDDAQLEAILASRDSKILRYFWRSRDLEHVTLEEYYEQYVLLKSRPAHGTFFADNPPPNTQCETMYARSRKKDHVCRIEVPSHFSVERYCLALLLRHAPHRSFSELLAGRETFAAAAYDHGLFSEHDEFESCLLEMIGTPLQEGYTYRSPNELRHVFIAMILSGASAPLLYEKYNTWMSLDLPHGVLHTTAAISPEQRERLLRRELELLLAKERRTLEDIGLPMLTDTVVSDDQLRHDEELRYTTVALDLHNCFRLSDSQRTVFNAATTAEGDRCMYVEAFAGCGKSYVAKSIIAQYRAQGHIVLVCAPSARAAGIFQGGQTCHSTFDLPVVDAGKEVVSTLRATTIKGRIAAMASLLVLDEAPMLHRKCFEAIDASLREIRSSDDCFGGVRVLMMGNFAQLGPVVPHEMNLLETSIRSSSLFRNFTLHELVEPQRDAEDVEYSCFVRSLAVGRGEFLSAELPSSVHLAVGEGDQQVIDNALEVIYRLLSHVSRPPRVTDHLFKSAVTASTNELVNAHNENVSRRLAAHLKSQIVQCKAREFCTDIDPEHQDLASCYIMEAYDDTQYPPHVLELFLGCHVQLTRNFLQSQGLTNGTSLIITSIGRNSIRAVKIDDQMVHGSAVTLSEFTFFRFRFNIELPLMFKFARLQFPFRIAFAVTVHRLQSVTITPPACLVIDMRVPPFAHALTYVAMSRACRGSQVRIISDPSHGRRLPVNVCFDLIEGFSYTEEAMRLEEEGIE